MWTKVYLQYITIINLIHKDLFLIKKIVKLLLDYCLNIIKYYYYNILIKPFFNLLKVKIRISK